MTFSNLNGYTAAGKVIKQALDNAQNNKPRRYSEKWKRSAAYRLGYYDGLLLAHCQLALGEYPTFNQKQIGVILEGTHETKTKS